MSHPVISLRYGSVCSGIDAVTVAWQPLGLAPVWFSEIDPFANAVLAHHYPQVPNLGDAPALPTRFDAVRSARRIFWWAARPASPSASPGFAADWRTRAVR